MDVGDKTDHLCDVVLNELVPSHFDGLRIGDVMASVQSIHLLSFHDLVDMSEFLQFLKKKITQPDLQEPLQQLARLGPSEPKDAGHLKILARYMTKKGLVCPLFRRSMMLSLILLGSQVSLVPAFVEGTLVGHLLLFAPSITVLIKLLCVPSELASSSSLIAALLPWETFPEEYRTPLGILPSSKKAPIPSELNWKKNMLKSKYQLALRILRFPPALHEWMSKSNRPYCIWPPPAAGDKKARETGYLLTILKQCGATKVSFKTDFRAVFVHVGGLETIHNMPLLLERRSQMCGIRFYTYGTDETVHPENWGVREIYPFGEKFLSSKSPAYSCSISGGVVTFTPSALYEDPWGVINTMKVIDKHPLWICYILPSVLGMAIKLSSPGEDPLAAFDKLVGSISFSHLLG